MKASTVVISWYQKWISPLFPDACRFYPSCSEYTWQCFEKYPWTRALFLSCKRLLKCHPYCEGGIDLAPARKRGQK